MTRARFTFLLSGVALAGLATPSAWAARAGWVESQEAPVYAGPGKGFQLMEKIPKGTALSTSNLPTEGFYKIRTESGVVGWVNAEAIVFAPAGGDSPTAKAEPAAAPAPVVPTYRRKMIRLRGVGGMDFFSVADVNSLLGFDGIKSGYNYGGEAAIRLTQTLSLALRFENVFKKVVARDTATLKTYQLDLSSSPMMIGAELELSRERHYALYLSALGGLGMNTKLLSTSLNEAAPNETELKDHAYTGLIKMTLDWAVAKSVSASLEGGYRLLKTDPITPATLEGAGKEIFTQNNAYVPVAIDLSGIVVGAGVSFSF